MLSSSNQTRHVSRAQLHAFCRGEVDPAQRGVIQRHLDECTDCRERHRQVAGMAGFLMEMGGDRDLDDLRWRRIRDAVRAELEVDAGQTGSLTADMAGRRWIVPALAASVVVALMVWAATPREGRVTTSAVDVDRNASTAADASGALAVQELVSGEGALTVTLASGARLVLDPHTQVRAATAGDGRRIELQLAVGAVRMRLPRRPPVAEAPVLSTPSFRLVALSEDFSAGYWADRYFIDVGSGRVRVQSDGLSDDLVVPAGQRHEVKVGVDRLPLAPAPQPPPASGPIDGPEREPDDESEPSVAPSVPKHRSQAPPPIAERPVSRSETGTVTVVEVERPANPVLDLWRRTTEAYYRDRDLERAANLAEQVIALGGTQTLLARQLLCDARIGLAEGASALVACRALLPLARSEEERRNIHFTVGTIHRTLLNDCARAIEHYNRALVFGRQHLLDDEVRVFRAGCALEVGDIALAERDIGRLSARAGRLARREEVTRLQRALAAAKKRLREGLAPAEATDQQ